MTSDVPPRSRWRVSVLGNSLPILMLPPRRDRSADATYPEHLERLLRAGGLDAEVRNDSRLFGLISEGYQRFEEDVVPWAPDVLIVHFGIIELQPNIVPTRLSRHFSMPNRGGKGLVGVYRRHAKPRLWPRVRTFQRKASGVLGPTRSFRFPPKDFEAELDRLIHVARNQHMLVLVCDINPPGGRLVFHLPGVEARYERYQEIIERVVAAAGDDLVRLVPVSKVVVGQGEDAMPDGLHLTAEGHLEVARMLAGEVAPWLGALAEGGE